MWDYDFVNGRTQDGRTSLILTLIDEFITAYLARRLATRIAIEALADVVVFRGVPENQQSAAIHFGDEILMVAR